MKTIDETARRRRPSAPAAQSMLDLSAPPRPRIATAELFPEDEPASAVAQLLTATPCRVCNARIAAYAPAKLCPACLSDLATTRAHVEQALDTSYATLRNAEAAWNSFVDSADDATRGRWERARGLLASGAVSDAFTRTWAQEIGACTALGYILKAYDTLRAAEQAAHELTVWHAAAMREIATAMESEALL